MHDYKRPVNGFFCTVDQKQEKSLATHVRGSLGQFEGKGLCLVILSMIVGTGPDAPHQQNYENRDDKPGELLAL